MARRKVFTNCLRCKRKITDPESQKIGYGPTCLLKTPSIVMQQLEKAGQMRLPGVR